MRFFIEDQLQEELLTVIGLTGHTTGSDIFNALVTFLEYHKLGIDKIVSIATDGAPVMVGCAQGLTSRLKSLNSNIIYFHCIIHQTVLTAKLNNEFKDLMNETMKLINFLKSKSPLRQRRLISFLGVLDANYSNLLTHNDVRWLSRGNSLARVWDLRHEILHFLDEIDSGENFETFYNVHIH